MQAPLDTACPTSPGAEQLNQPKKLLKNAFMRLILVCLQDQSRNTWVTKVIDALKSMIQICSGRLAAALKNINFQPLYLSAKRGELERKNENDSVFFHKIVRVIKQQKRNILSVVKRIKATDITADKTIPSRRKSVRVRKVEEAVKTRISRNPRRSRISPVLVPPQSRQVSGSSSRPMAEISEFVHVVVIGIHCHVNLEILKSMCLTVFQ